MRAYNSVVSQATVHIKGVTECFECAPKPAPKTYPVCTIRNTPDKLIHCVVWAKELLFAKLFGPRGAANDLDDENGMGCWHVARSTRRNLVDSGAFAPRDGENHAAYAARVFDRVFGADVERLLTVEVRRHHSSPLLPPLSQDLWKARPKPTPRFLSQTLVDGVGECAQGPTASKALGLHDAHAVWSLADNARVFVHAVQLFLRDRADEVGSAVFDKDDALAVEVVASAANLRASSYGIPTESVFAIKVWTVSRTVNASFNQQQGMAGNIIHAIATTNAIVSGLIVTEACKLLAGMHTATASTFLKEHVSNKKVRVVVYERLATTNNTHQQVLVATSSPAPNPHCIVCGRAEVVLTTNVHTMTLQQLLDKVRRTGLCIYDYVLMDIRVRCCEGHWPLRAPRSSVASFCTKKGRGWRTTRLPCMRACCQNRWGASLEGDCGAGRSSASPTSCKTCTCAWWCSTRCA